jgi:hypothetical protein
MDELFYNMSLAPVASDFLQHRLYHAAPLSKNRKILEPIWQSLASQQAKLALKLSTKALDKATKEVQPLLKCTKCLALIALQRQPEAVAVMSTLIKAHAMLETPEIMALMCWTCSCLKNGQSRQREGFQSQEILQTPCTTNFWMP